MSFIQQFFTSRDNNANAETFVGQEGRLWWDPVTNQIYSSDGVTPGGIPLAGGGGNGSPGGSNGQVQFNQSGNFGGSANLTFNNLTGTLTAVSFVGNGAGLTNVTGANVSGTVANATYATTAGSATTAATVTDNAQPNITSVGVLSSVSSTGNITADYYIGNGSLLTGINAGSSYSNANVAAYLPTYTGNLAGALLSVTGNITGALLSVSGNITGGNVNLASGRFAGGSLSVLGGVTGGGLTTAGNLGVSGNAAVGNLSTAGNVTAGYFIGNGSTLTSIAGANVTGNVANATYAVNAGTVTTAAQPNITSVGNLTSITSSGDISTTGNISGNYYIGNGSQLTGIVSSYGNSNVAAYLPTYTGNLVALTGNVITTANISGGNIIGSLVGNLTGTTASLTANVTGGNLLTGGLISATSNIIGGNLNATGLSLSGNVISAINTTANITTTANISGGNLIGTFIGNISGNVTGTTASLSGNVTGGNLLTGGLISATGNITGGNISATGNIVGGNIGAGGTPNYYNISGYTSTITVVAPTTGAAMIETVGSAGNSGTISFGNVNFRQAAISSTVTNDLSFLVNFSGISNTVAQSLVLYSNLNARFANAVTAVANITGGNILTGGLISAAGNSQAANMIVPADGGLRANSTTNGQFGIFDHNQNTGAYKIINLGTGATISSSNTQINIGTQFGITATNLYGNVIIANTLTSLSTGTISLLGNISTSANISATANITGGNLLTGGLITATGNITAGNIINNGSESVTGNIIGGNILTGGLISATGNITSAANVTGGNLLTGGILSSTGNATFGNISTAGLITATGNITIGNVNTGGRISATGNVLSNNISATGTITATGATNATAFAVGNSAVSNVALGYFPTAGTPAEMAVRDYSTVASTMYFDNSVGSANVQGTFQFRGSNSFTQWAKIDQYGINLPTRPAFRVYGNTSTNFTTGTTLTNQVIDYNQGSNYVNSTGIFTAPVGGLYSVWLNARAGATASLSQIGVFKNGNTSAANTVCFWEITTNATQTTHFGVSSVTKLAAGDTLQAKVVAGGVNFDSNDNWGAAYIG